MDHPSTIERKARTWLPRCVPDGHEYGCVETKHGGDGKGDGDGEGGGDASYAIFIAPRTRRGEEGDHGSVEGGAREDGSTLTTTELGDHRRDMVDAMASSSSSAAASSTSDYHLIGHDLRSSPDALLRKLSHPNHGYDGSLSSSTLFVLECVLMYLPETSARDLLRRIAAIPASRESSPSSSSSSQSSSRSFVAVAIYDPIPGHDRFGQLMIENLKRAGIVADGGRGGGGLGRRRHADDNEPREGAGEDDEDEDDRGRRLLSLEATRTLADQLSRLVRACGFDAAVGCDMADAYDHGVVRREDRDRATRIEALDELEEFDLLMRHYSLLVGVSSSSSSSSTSCQGGVHRPDGTGGPGGGAAPASSARGGDDHGGDGGRSDAGIRLCSVGADSPMGFREGRCTVMMRSI